MGMRLEHINYIYSPDNAFRKHALKDVNLEIKDGEFIGLIGHTGSGKSTLIQHLNGILKATDGKIYFNDQDIYDPRFKMRGLRSRVGLVFQYPEHQLFEISVLKDVCYGPKNLGLSDDVAEACAKEALAMVGMTEKDYDKSPFDLSGGQKRRVAIAGVLAMHPDIIILDEATSMLDPLGREEINNLVHEIHEKNDMTIISITHDIEEVAMSDRVIVLDKGKVRMEGKPEDVLKRESELVSMNLDVPFGYKLSKALKAQGIAVHEDILIEEVVNELCQLNSKM